MKDLIERLEKAEAGSRELDADVVEALGECAHRKTTYYNVQGDTGFDCDDCGKDPHRPGIAKVTTSLDAALALAERVMPGWGWVMSSGAADQPAWVQAYPEPADEDIYRDAVASPSLAIALCLAVLKAKEVTNEQ